MAVSNLSSANNGSQPVMKISATFRILRTTQEVVSLDLSTAGTGRDSFYILLGMSSSSSSVAKFVISISLLYRRYRRTFTADKWNYTIKLFVTIPAIIWCRRKEIQFSWNETLLVPMSTFVLMCY